MKMKKDHIDATSIDLGLGMDINIVNVESVSLWWCLYVLSSTWATFEAKVMKKWSNTEAKLKKSVAYKKACITIMPANYTS